MGRLAPVVLCGFGRFGRVYARRVLEHESLDLVGVVELPSVYPAIRDADLRPFDSLREALDVTSARIVLVATPAEYQARLALEALSRHADVILAKPGALSLDEAVRVAARAWELGRRVFVDYTPRENWYWKALKSEALEDGVVSARFIRRSTGGGHACGVLWDLAPHDVALAVDLDRTDKVARVLGVEWSTTRDDSVDGAYLHLTHASGRVSRIEVDRSAYSPERRVEIVDREGVGSWDAILETTSGRDDVSLMLDRVVDARRVGSSDDTVLYLEVIRILEAAEISHALGAEVSLDARSAYSLPTPSTT